MYVFNVILMLEQTLISLSKEAALFRDPKMYFMSEILLFKNTLIELPDKMF